MAAIFLTALTLGMIGSFHCIGMCGPIAFALPLNTMSDFAKFLGSFLYNAGRIITYSFLGFIVGWAGKSFSLFGFQQWLSIVVGIFILCFVFAPKKWVGISAANNIIARYSQQIRGALSKLFIQKNYRSLFSIGILNGLLPCGMVYMAIAAAVVTASPAKGAFFMAAFGLGTLPVMWGVSFFGNYISLQFRKKIRSAYPIIITAMACLLIVRGLGLGIPYVSPSINMVTKLVQQCHPVVKN